MTDFPYRYDVTHTTAEIVDAHGELRTVTVVDRAALRREANLAGLLALHALTQLLRVDDLEAIRLHTDAAGEHGEQRREHDDAETQPTAALFLRRALVGLLLGRHARGVGRTRLVTTGTLAHRTRPAELRRRCVPPIGTTRDGAGTSI